MRVGIGYDIHQLVESNELTFKLSGISIPFEKRCVAHSDGDVAIHALLDALLGAAALGDIGTHFPDTDPKYKNADSAILLQECYQLLKSNGYIIENIDLNIITEKPKLEPYISLMRTRLSEILQIEIYRISIKAKTNEQLDAIGRGEAIAAQAVVMIR
ncbi:MAG: 2-C-methyl-D-erythritol 2,4-cyclodiphosphate synthase [Bacteroidetes bacterium]|nr:2-C-methyl-D-erythritol 2,4-cyclodiphosphate synthase [Bacteroidota bacterium]MCL1968724.1 2-C-methyl-D-erythritol 2,4-cyclodiphosphate synthase [Bacteroidota bacterium]